MAGKFCRALLFAEGRFQIKKNHNEIVFCSQTPEGQSVPEPHEAPQLFFTQAAGLKLSAEQAHASLHLPKVSLAAVFTPTFWEVLN